MPRAKHKELNFRHRLRGRKFTDNGLFSLTHRAKNIKPMRAKVEKPDMTPIEEPVMAIPVDIDLEALNAKQDGAKDVNKAKVILKASAPSGSISYGTNGWKRCNDCGKKIPANGYCLCHEKAEREEVYGVMVLCK